ncbi:hypothetical protein VDGD_08897 [Verticillium dahliae]|nr:hypothetical protein VDGD_08897 [Verticillium dahliae]
MLGLFFSHSPPSTAPSRQQLDRPGHRRPNSNSFSLPTYPDFTPVSPTHLRTPPPSHIHNVSIRVCSSSFTPTSSVEPRRLRPPGHPGRATPATWTERGVSWSATRQQDADLATQHRASVSQECIEAYNDLKLNKKYKYIVFKLSDDNKQIVIEEASENKDWETFRERLINATSKSKTGAVGKGPRYAVYDFQYSLASGEGERNKIAFIAWSPDDAGIMAKMIYASSKEALKRSLTGLATELQANDPDDIEYDSIIKTVSKGLAA